MTERDLNIIKKMIDEAYEQGDVNSIEKIKQYIFLTFNKLNVKTKVSFSEQQFEILNLTINDFIKYNDLKAENTGTNLSTIGIFYKVYFDEKSENRAYLQSIFGDTFRIYQLFDLDPHIREELKNDSAFNKILSFLESEYGITLERFLENETEFHKYLLWWKNEYDNNHGVVRTKFYK